MRWSDLEKLLLSLEGKCVLPACPPLGAYNPPAVQAFALDNSKGTTDDWPVVVAVGSNYGQGAGASHHPSITWNLSSWNAKLVTGMNAYNANKIYWFDQKAASSSSLVIPDKFHLVMTNFCMWITTDRWPKVPAQVRANLLVENPLFSGRPVPGNGDWPHLDALADALKNYEQPVLWVGHGLDSEVFSLFRLWAKKRGDIKNWVLLPNLSYPYSGKYKTYNKTYPCLSTSDVTPNK